MGVQPQGSDRGSRTGGSRVPLAQGQGGNLARKLLGDGSEVKQNSGETFPKLVGRMGSGG